MFFMKKIIFTLYLLLILVSCKTSKEIVKENWLVGKWNIVAIDTGEEIPENNKAEYDEIMKGMIKNAFMQFNSDQSFEMQLMGQKLAGIFEINEEKTELITSINGEEGLDQFKVLLFERGKMLLETEDDEGKMTLTLMLVSQ